MSERIIPARAGFTQFIGVLVPPGRDHPRSRGVYQGHTLVKGIHVGSSPLARGLPERVNGFIHARRIIPARAGFTRPLLAEYHNRRDHPRSRGVYETLSELSPDGVGSSPLARGLRTAAHAVAELERIIPARAGFTHRS